MTPNPAPPLGTFTLHSGYRERGKPGKLMTFRNPVNIAEMVNHCNTHTHIWFLSNDGTARECKVNGAVRTWKRDPNRVEVPVKYGLYEYGTFYASDIERVLIPA